MSLALSSTATLLLEPGPPSPNATRAVLSPTHPARQPLTVPGPSCVWAPSAASSAAAPSCMPTSGVGTASLCSACSILSISTSICSRSTHLLGLLYLNSFALGSQTIQTVESPPALTRPTFAKSKIVIAVPTMTSGNTQAPARQRGGQDSSDTTTDSQTIGKLSS